MGNSMKKATGKKGLAWAVQHADRPFVELCAQRCSDKSRFEGEIGRTFAVYGKSAWLARALAIAALSFENEAAAVAVAEQSGHFLEGFNAAEHLAWAGNGPGSLMLAMRLKMGSACEARESLWAYADDHPLYGISGEQGRLKLEDWALGAYPLHFAAQRGSIGTAQWLIGEGGADPLALTAQGRAAWEVAWGGRGDEKLRLLCLEAAAQRERGLLGKAAPEAPGQRRPIL